MRDPVKQLMAGIFKVPAGEIPDDATIGRVEQWDSMHHLELMLALSQKIYIQALRQRRSLSYELL